MKSLCFRLAATLLIPLFGHAQTADLEALGGKLKRENDAVVELEFRASSKLGPAEWRAIGQLTELRKLTVYGGAKGLDDETVGQLATLTKLESLSIDGAQLSDAGLEKLAALTNLQSAAFFHLSFRMEGFTGKGFAAWRSMPKLEKLTVAGMTMGDEGFAAIGTLIGLTDLRVWHTCRTEASNAEIAKLPKLTSLRLGQRLPQGPGTPTSLSDASLPTLAKILTLESLEIGEAAFTLEALGQLKALPNLKRLKIYNTSFTEADIEKLRQQLPDVEIVYEPQTEDQRKKLESYLR